MGLPTPTKPEGDGPKRRACDECRSRKLACTKEADGCSRCKRDGVRCHYSLQKPMGRPRKARKSQEAQAHGEDAPPSRPLILPASDSAMDLDLDMAFFDMDDVNFLDLMGGDLGMNNQSPMAPQLPKPPMRQSPSPGVWQMMSAEHLTPDIDFNYDLEPQPLSEEISIDQAVNIMTADMPETIPLPALSPEQSSNTSSHPSPSDHSLNNSPPICSCLSSLYLALDSLQRLPPSATSAIKVARSASRTAYTTITCPICSTPPLDHHTSDPANPPIQSFQNMMMLGALLPSLSNAYKTILRQVDEEAAAATLTSTPLVFDIASVGGLWGALAASECASKDIDRRTLDPAMWRLALRALLKVDVYGISGCAHDDDSGKDSRGEAWQLGLKDIIRMMEERSRSRHEELDRLVREGVLNFDGRCEYVPLDNGRGDKPTCFRIIDVAKRSMQSLEIA